MTISCTRHSFSASILSVNSWASSVVMDLSPLCTNPSAITISIARLLTPLWRLVGQLSIGLAVVVADCLEWISGPINSLRSHTQRRGELTNSGHAWLGASFDIEHSACCNVRLCGELVHAQCRVQACCCQCWFVRHNSSRFHVRHIRCGYAGQPRINGQSIHSFPSKPNQTQRNRPNKHNDQQL